MYKSAKKCMKYGPSKNYKNSGKMFMYSSKTKEQINEAEEKQQYTKEIIIDGFYTGIYR